VVAQEYGRPSSFATGGAQLALWLVHVLIAGTLGAILLQTLLNHFAVARLGRYPESMPTPRVAVLIPARDEAAAIGIAVRGWLAQDYPDYEIVVLDDASRDATATRAAAAGGTRVRVVRNDSLPDGWRGKAHACHRLRAETRAELLAFADADIRPAPSALTAAVATLAALGVDALSALPRHESASLGVRALVALQNWAPFALTPLWLPAARRRPIYAVTNGQFLIVRADVYDRIGGFAAVHDDLGEDAAFGRRLVACGARLGLAEGTGLLRCHPYQGVRAVWDANVRNLESAFLGSRALLVAVAAAAAILVLGPPALLTCGIVTQGAPTVASAAPPLLEMALLVASRVVTDARAGYAWWLALSHPPALLATAAMALAAARPRREIRWRGRRYASRSRAA